jgi:hypothetical protein
VNTDVIPYAPQPGSLPYRMLQYFVRNAMDELTLRDVTTKFGVNRTAVGAGLAKAVKHDLIEQTRGPGQQRIYRAGKELTTYASSHHKALGLHLPPAADRSIPTWEQRAANHGETLRLSLAIADAASRTDIELHCIEIAYHGYIWFDIQALRDDDPSVRAMVDRSLRYLRLRGHVIAHPTQEALVRFPG